jgi:hypothetical protein
VSSDGGSSSASSRTWPSRWARSTGASTSGRRIDVLRHLFALAWLVVTTVPKFIIEEIRRFACSDS